MCRTENNGVMNYDKKAYLTITDPGKKILDPLCVYLSSHILTSSPNLNLNNNNDDDNGTTTA